MAHGTLRSCIRSASSPSWQSQLQGGHTWPVRDLVSALSVKKWLRADRTGNYMATVTVTISF